MELLALFEDRVPGDGLESCAEGVGIRCKIMLMDQREKEERERRPWTSRQRIEKRVEEVQI